MCVCVRERQGQLMQSRHEQRSASGPCQPVQHASGSSAAERGARQAGESDGQLLAAAQ